MNDALTLKSLHPGRIPFPQKRDTSGRADDRGLPQKPPQKTAPQTIAHCLGRFSKLLAGKGFRECVDAAVAFPLGVIESRVAARSCGEYKGVKNRVELGSRKGSVSGRQVGRLLDGPPLMQQGFM